MTITRLFLLPMLFMSLFVTGRMWVILCGLAILVDVAHSREWSVAKFTAWLFGLIFGMLAAYVMTA